MQQVRESDLPVARALTGVRKRSQESVGRQGPLASVCGSRSSRRPGSPCLPGATAAPRRSSACSSTASCAGATTSRCSPRATRTREASLVSDLREGAQRRPRADAAGAAARAHLRARCRQLRCRQRSHGRARAGALEPHLDAVPEHRARNARGRGGRALPARLRGHARRGARVADREPSRERARPALGRDDSECHRARRPPVPGAAAAASTSSGSAACRPTRAP